MAKHLIIFLEDGHVRTVAADFQTDIECVVVSPAPVSTVEGEPWIRHVGSRGLGKAGNAVITPARIEFLPEAVKAVVSSEDISKIELLKLLKPAEGQ